MSYVIETLKALPLEQLIGGPLKAAVEAQDIAAKTTVDFISAVGFTPQTTDPFDTRPVDRKNLPAVGPNALLGPVRTVTFTYQTMEAGRAAKTASLTVPVLTIVPIPFLRIDEMTIDFTVEMTEFFAEDKSETAGQEGSASFRADAGWGPYSVGFTAAFSARHNTLEASASRYGATATMNINVRAVQDDIPAGLSRVLDILESSIKEQRVALPAPKTK